jgi:hypothetical protein
MLRRYAGGYVMSVVVWKFSDELFADQMVFDFSAHCKFINGVKIG